MMGQKRSRGEYEDQNPLGLSETLAMLKEPEVALAIPDKESQTPLPDSHDSHESAGDWQ